jgi:hypothetical protein
MNYSLENPAAGPAKWIAIASEQPTAPPLTITPAWHFICCRQFQMTAIP